MSKQTKKAYEEFGKDLANVKKNWNKINETAKKKKEMMKQLGY
tara:strand:- start:129 stop:257 length:129 start_codon:yes stop_codon:yes gene_type:complete